MPTAPRLSNLVLSLVVTLVRFGVATAEIVRRQREGAVAVP
ncbi:hypothetical protein ABZV78_01520 [Micromonospora sp. NPDC004540]